MSRLSVSLAVALAWVVLVAACRLSYADEDYRFETYVTVDYSGRSAAFASSTVWSLFGPIDEPGLRLKIAGLTGIDGDANANAFSGSFTASDVKTSAGVMAGYQFIWEDIWIKLYAGIACVTTANHVTTSDAFNINTLLAQKSLNGAAAIETYWEDESGFWLSGGVSWLQHQNTGSFYGRAAYKIMKEEGDWTLSGGAETGASMWQSDSYKVGTHLDYEKYVRGGVLLNLRYGSNELTISGGLARELDENRWRPYATISFGMKF